MKRNALIITSLTIILSSCMPPSFFQVYKVKPSENIVSKENALVYEDDNCKVYYNFWEEGGNVGFRFYNKTENQIYLNLEESFFILNGIAYDYYKNRVFTKSKTSGTSLSNSASLSESVTGVNYYDLIQTNKLEISSNIGTASSFGYSVSYNEEKIICIPAHTSKIIMEYKVNETLYRDCELFRFPTKKQIKTKTFSKSDSPIVFSNKIAYYLGNSDNLNVFKNEFFISEISNHPYSEIIEEKYDEYCGEKSLTLVKYFINDSADKFYIKYTKGQNLLKH